MISNLGVPTVIFPQDQHFMLEKIKWHHKNHLKFITHFIEDNEHITNACLITKDVKRI